MEKKGEALSSNCERAFGDTIKHPRDLGRLNVNPVAQAYKVSACELFVKYQDMRELLCLSYMY